MAPVARESDATPHAVGEDTLLRTLAFISLVAAVLALGPGSARAQRIIFPSEVGGTPAASPSDLYTPPPISTLPSFDPYGVAPATPAPALLPAAPAETGIMRSDGIFIPSPRFLEQVRFESEWIPRNGTGGLGITSLEANASFAFPLIVQQPPFFVTPGFAVHFWDGPSSTAFQGFPQLPGSTYDAYLDTAWRPVVTPWLSADLGFRFGVYSDFNFVDNHSLRYIGRGLGIVTLNPRWQAAAGIVYLDRFGIKLLPAGGLIWTPNQDVRWEMLFPRPKLAQRMTTFRNTDLWVYAAGEYGGGRWTFERSANVSPFVDGHAAYDYNDYRVMLGVETKGVSRLRAWFEVGFIWGRTVKYYYTDPGIPSFSPNETVMLRGGLLY